MSLSLRSSAFAIGFVALVVVAVVAPVSPAAAQSGAQFQVNSYTTGNQQISSIAVAPSGQFVVVWRSSAGGGDSDGNSVQGACFNADGSPLGAQFQVNQFTTNSQNDPEVEVADDGSFVVAWYSDASGDFDTDGQSVHARQYDSTCSPDANEFEVNTYTTGAQLGVEVEVADDGDFIVLWRTNASGQGDTSSNSVQARRFSSNGTAIDAGEFQVNTYTTSGQREGRAAFQSNGDFVVVFKSSGSIGGDSSGYSVQARRYASSGTALDANEFQVNTYTTNTQATPDVAVQSDGDFLVVWATFSSDLGDNDGAIIARRYDSGGNPQTGEFRVNSYTPGSLTEPRVAIADDDSFVVTWQQSGSPQDTSGNGIRAAFISADTYPSSGFQVNDFTTNSQNRSRVGVTGGGQFVIAWESYGSVGNDDDSNSIQAGIGQMPFFFDGFESGDVSRWSSATP